MNIIVKRDPVVIIPIGVQMSDKTWFLQQRVNQAIVPHEPSPIELSALERELQEVYAWMRFRAQQYKFNDLAMPGRLLAVAQTAGAALEQLAPSLSEARDRMEHTR